MYESMFSFASTLICVQSCYDFIVQVDAQQKTGWNRGCMNLCQSSEGTDTKFHSCRGFKKFKPSNGSLLPWTKGAVPVRGSGVVGLWVRLPAVRCRRLVVGGFKSWSKLFPSHFSAAWFASSLRRSAGYGRWPMVDGSGVRF